MKHQRAIEELEKIERRQQIINAAAALFQSNSFEQISMQRVAGEAGIAKGTLYLYFKTKEALFLALMEDEFSAWFADLERRLPSMSNAEAQKQINSFAQGLTASMANHPCFVRLLPILHSIIEHNIPYVTALSFKQQLLAHLQHTGAAIEQAFHFLRPGQGAEMLLAVYAQLIGLQSIADPPPVIQQVLENPELRWFKIEVMDALSRTVVRLLEGYLAENTRSIWKKRS